MSEKDFFRLSIAQIAEFRKYNSRLEYSRKILSGMQLVSYHNVNYKDKIKLSDVIGENPERELIKEKKATPPPSVIKAAFLKIFPMSKKTKKGDNINS